LNTRRLAVYRPGNVLGHPGSQPRHPRQLSLAMAVLVALGSTSVGVAASAVENDLEKTLTQGFPLVQIFTFLFLMLGPFKIIGPFAAVTKGADVGVARRIAFQATLFACAALLIAAILGDRILVSYGIPVPVLALSAGIILFLVALQTILQQFSPASETPAASTAAPSMRAAITPLAFPTIVTPYGIAALVVFIALAPDFETQLIIGAIVVAIMCLNLAVMLLDRYILPAFSLFLPILGAVLGVVQVALGLQIIKNSLSAMGVL
jgi:multiple antibiotic resistance protein